METPLKIVCNGQTIDVIMADPVWVKQGNGFRLRCEPEAAQGIVSRDGSTTYQLENTSLMDGADQMLTVSAVAISEEEAAAILDALEAGRPTPEPEVSIDPDGSIEMVMENTIAKMSAACNAAIVSGVDVTLTDGNSYHFSLTVEDQINLISLQTLIAGGAEAVPYHADGEECRYYSLADFQLIATAATSWKIYHESYVNSLRAYIRAMETMAELIAVTYGMSIPEEYQTDVLKGLLAQMEDG